MENQSTTVFNTGLSYLFLMETTRKNRKPTVPLLTKTSYLITGIFEYSNYIAPYESIKVIYSGRSIAGRPVSFITALQTDQHIQTDRHYSVSNSCKVTQTMVHVSISG